MDNLDFISHEPFEIHIEYNDKASYHVRHNPDEYRKHFVTIAAALQRKFHCQVIANPGGDHIWRQLWRVDNKTQYPRYGSFEISMHSAAYGTRRVFSKLETGKWPNIPVLLRRILGMTRENGGVMSRSSFGFNGTSFDSLPAGVTQYTGFGCPPAKGLSEALFPAPSGHPDHHDFKEGLSSYLLIPEGEDAPIPGGPLPQTSPSEPVDALSAFGAANRQDLGVAQVQYGAYGARSAVEQDSGDFLGSMSPTWGVEYSLNQGHQLGTSEGFDEKVNSFAQDRVKDCIDSAPLSSWASPAAAPRMAFENPPVGTTGTAEGAERMWLWRKSLNYGLQRGNAEHLLQGAQPGKMQTGGGLETKPLSSRAYVEHRQRRIGPDSRY
jgi:hypothetical protein